MCGFFVSRKSFDQLNSFCFNLFYKHVPMFGVNLWGGFNMCHLPHLEVCINEDPLWWLFPDDEDE